VYFPRLILPVAAVAPGLVYLAVLLIVLAVTVVVFHQRDGVWYVSLTPRLLASLGAIVVSLMFAIAVGLWTSVLQARYRDIRYALRYITPFWFLLTPVVYPLSEISSKYSWLVALKPMAPIVEAFKWGTLGTAISRQSQWRVSLGPHRPHHVRRACGSFSREEVRIGGKVVTNEDSVFDAAPARLRNYTSTLKSSRAARPSDPPGVHDAGQARRRAPAVGADQRSSGNHVSRAR
jgi:hypothetical protein